MSPFAPRTAPPLALAAVALAGLVACAGMSRPVSRAKPSVETLPDGTKVICQREKPTGSNIPEMVCRTAADVEHARQETQRDLSRPRGGAPMPKD